MAMFFFLLIMLVALIWLVITVLGGTMGPSFNRFNPFIRSTTPGTLTEDGALRSRHPTTPSCGQCGYPARGISTLECPECGADLREVGIFTGRHNTAPGSGCVIPVLFSVAVLIVAASLHPVIVSQLPSNAYSQYQIGIVPASQQYAQVSLDVDMLDRLSSQPNNISSTYGISSSSAWSSTGGKTTTLSVGSHSAQGTIQTLRLYAAPNSPGQAAWRMAHFEVDPVTRQARWTTPTGTSNQTRGPFSDQDVAAFLAGLGADTSNATVQAEAQELYAFMDGLLSGMTNFSFNHFSPSGLSTGISYTVVPRWFVLGYLVLWLLLWVGGLLLITRRRKQGNDPADEWASSTSPRRS